MPLPAKMITWPRQRPKGRARSPDPGRSPRLGLLEAVPGVVPVARAKVHRAGRDEAPPGIQAAESGAAVEAAPRSPSLGPGFRPLQVPVQERERTLAVDRVPAVEELDRRPVGQPEVVVDPAHP